MILNRAEPDNESHECEVVGEKQVKLAPIPKYDQNSVTTVLQELDVDEIKQQESFALVVFSESLEWLLSSCSELRPSVCRMEFVLVCKLRYNKSFSVRSKGGAWREKQKAFE